MNTSEERIIKLATDEELDKDLKKINEMNDDLNEVIEKSYKLNNFFNISLTQLFVRMSNATIDVFKEFIEVIFKERKFKYQEKFKWWKRYNDIFSDMYIVLSKDDRLIYFGFFLIFLAILLNFLDMIH
tara:strand:- start:1792 stop:2175 length:384 start_codon:yes stop_codon:yes gene_type:complete